MPDFVLKKRAYALKSAENKKNAASVEVDKCGVHLGAPCWAQSQNEREQQTESDHAEMEQPRAISRLAQSVGGRDEPTP